MNALSIRQPWAWLIIRPDLVGEARQKAIADRLIKDCENREWQSHYGGPLLIHAAQGMTHDEYRWARYFVLLKFDGRICIPAPDDLQRGGIIGRVQMEGCTSQPQSPWFTGRFGFQFSNPEPLPFQPCRGMPGLFNIAI